MAAHALLSPSSAEKWLNCPGALAMEQGLPDTGSEYADEGTAAHFLAEQCLNAECDPATYYERVIALWTHPTSETEGCGFTDCLDPSFEFGNVFKVDGDMVRHVRTYVQAVQEYASNGELMVEQSLPISHVTGEDDACGTGDAIIIAGDEITVIDLKYGQGVQIDAEDNSQLKIYALGAVERFAMLGDFKTARLAIIQPRLNHVSEWAISIEDLLKWGEHVKARATHALNVLANEKPGAYVHHLRPSESACRWCKAKAICPKLAETVQVAIGAEFTDLTTADKPEQETIIGGLVKPLETVGIGTALDAVPLVEMWCKAIRAKAESELLAGNPVAGYKLVQGKRGNRAWSDAEEAEKVLKSMRMKQDEMYTFNLISPTTAEKLLKDTPKRWSRISDLIVQNEGKPSVAPISDKRPALEIKPVKDDFSVITIDGEDLV